MTMPKDGAKRVAIPSDFPHAQRLGDRDLFREVLGGVAVSTFSRWLALGKIPQPKKLGALNRWTEEQMAAVRDGGLL
jgi:hypothetical protein